MIEIYNPKNKNFKMNGDITLTPTECRYTVESNTIYEVQIIHPYDNLGRWKYIKEDAVLKGPLPNGKSGLFKVLKPSKNLDNITANCVPIAIYELGKKVLPSTLKIVNKNGQQALDIILQGTDYKGHSDIETENNCTFFKNNIMQALAGEQDNTFLKRWGGGLQFIGYDIYINSKPNGSTRVAYGFNMQEIELERDMSNLVTRIYPFVTLETTNTIDLPEGHVDSPLINKYSQVYEVYMDFSEYMHLKTDNEDNSDNAYTTKEELYNAMRARCLELFNQGIDKPTVSGSVSASTLQNTLECKGFEGILNIDQGYIVNIEHTDIGIETQERCSGFTWDMLEEEFIDIKIGINKENSFDLQNDFVNKADYILNPNGTVNSAKLQGTINALDTKFRALRNVAEEQHIRAMLFEDRAEGSKTRGALCIGTSGFEIASEMDSNGEWIWRTFGDGSGFTADEIRTGVLRNLDNSFAIDLNSKGSAKFYNNNQLALKIMSNSLKLFNWGKEGQEIGALTSLLKNDDNGKPIPAMPLISLLNEKNSAVTIDYRTSDNQSKSYVEFDKFNILKSSDTAPIRVKEDIEFRNSSIFNAKIKADQTIPHFVDGVNVANFLKDKIAFNVPIAPIKGITNEKVIPFYIGDTLVAKFEGDKFTLNIPIYNKNGTLALDPAAPQGETIVVDDSDALRQKVVNSARKLIGRMYLFGGNVAPLGNDSSTDCSGLMQWSYNDNNIHISRTTYTQIKEGVEVSKDNLKPADLIFSNFSSPGIPEHVFMYAGKKNGQMYCVEAAHTGTAIRERVFIWQDGMRARRIIKDNPHTVTPGGTTAGGGTTGVAGDKASRALIMFTKEQEGFASMPYNDGGGNGGTMTIGYGLVGNELHQAESSGLPLSETTATHYLVSYFNKSYYTPTLKLIQSKGITPTQAEADSLADFCYNEGYGSLSTSHLLIEFVNYVKGGRKDSSKLHQEFMKWTLAGGIHLEGLRVRREQEFKILIGAGKNVEGYGTKPTIQDITNGGVVTANGGYGAEPY